MMGSGLGPIPKSDLYPKPSSHPLVRFPVSQIYRFGLKSWPVLFLQRSSLDPISLLTSRTSW